MKKLNFIFPFVVCFILCTTVYALSVQKDLSDELLRLHIIANSNSEYDQKIKLMVRDEIVASAGEEFLRTTDKAEYKRLLLEKSEEIEKLANNVLEENKVDYRAKCSFKTFYVPRKTYGNIVLPEGSYDGLIIDLGNSDGENWWCVVYPPLCFTEGSLDAENPEAIKFLEDNLSPQSFSLITQEGIDIEYKLKTVEIFQKLKKRLLK